MSPAGLYAEPMSGGSAVPEEILSEQGVKEQTGDLAFQNMAATPGHHAQRRQASVSTDQICAVQAAVGCLADQIEALDVADGLIDAAINSKRAEQWSSIRAFRVLRATPRLLLDAINKVLRARRMERVFCALICRAQIGSDLFASSRAWNRMVEGTNQLIERPTLHYKGIPSALPGCHSPPLVVIGRKDLGWGFRWRYEELARKRYNVIFATENFGLLCFNLIPVPLEDKHARRSHLRNMAHHLPYMYMNRATQAQLRVQGHRQWSVSPGCSICQALRVLPTPWDRIVLHVPFGVRPSTGGLSSRLKARLKLIVAPCFIATACAARVSQGAFGVLKRPTSGLLAARHPFSLGAERSVILSGSPLVPVCETITLVGSSVRASGLYWLTWVYIPGSGWWTSIGTSLCGCYPRRKGDVLFRRPAHAIEYYTESPSPVGGTLPINCSHDHSATNRQCSPGRLVYGRAAFNCYVSWVISREEAQAAAQWVSEWDGCALLVDESQNPAAAASALQFMSRPVDMMLDRARALITAAPTVELPESIRLSSKHVMAIVTGDAAQPGYVATTEITILSSFKRRVVAFPVDD
uniref:Uncharacterized protein n=1 Tax=viral metagenome TaxID=1070528 RepID=A0A2V0RLM1_9ZZZZ